MRGTSSSNAISPKYSPGAQLGHLVLLPVLRDQDVDLALLDDVEAVAGVALREDALPRLVPLGRKPRRDHRHLARRELGEQRQLGQKAAVLDQPVDARGQVHLLRQQQLEVGAVQRQQRAVGRGRTVAVRGTFLTSAISPK